MRRARVKVWMAFLSIQSAGVWGAPNDGAVVMRGAGE